MSQLPSHRPTNVAIVSDISVGYGTPQILRIANSFSEIYGAHVKIYETDQSERPPIRNLKQHVASDNVSLKRVYTIGHPASMEGRLEYTFQILKFLQEYKPEAIVLTGVYMLPLLEMLKYKPRLTIMYFLEYIEDSQNYMFSSIDHCDIVIFPEKNRRRIIFEQMKVNSGEIDSEILYNANNTSNLSSLETPKNGRIFYGGSFHRELTYAEYFLRPKIMNLPIDIYGIIDGFDDSNAVSLILCGNGDGINYCGYREADPSFFKTMSEYTFSLVIWNPDREDRLYAAPNKFFDSIANGVPPICAPHPQCVDLIKRWNCGLLMDDWSFESFYATVRKAINIQNTDYYLELRKNCKIAFNKELSWQHQFGRLTQKIDKFMY